MAQLRGDEERLQAQLDRAEVVAAGPEPEQVVALADELVRLWSVMDSGQRNRALRALVDHVVILPAARYRQPARERIRVVWW
jgi:hypothetical protein